MVEDAIGLVILVLIAVILMVLAGLSALFSTDLMSSAVSWIGQGPAVGWALLGAIGGGLFAVIQGMKARGKSDDLRKAYLGAAVVGMVLLASGVTSPAGRALIGW